MEATNGSPWRIAATPACCRKVVTPLVVYCTCMARVAPRDGGCTSQPSRQPVIAQDLEKLLITNRRASGSAWSRMDCALRRPKARGLEDSLAASHHTRGARNATLAARALTRR